MNHPHEIKRRAIALAVIFGICSVPSAARAGGTNPYGNMRLPASVAQVAVAATAREIRLHGVAGLDRIKRSILEISPTRRGLRAEFSAKGAAIHSVSSGETVLPGDYCDALYLAYRQWSSARSGAIGLVGVKAVALSYETAESPRVHIAVAFIGARQVQGGLRGAKVTIGCSNEEVFIVNVQTYATSSAKKVC